MRVIGIDVETTGLDCKKDHITEIGACLWDCESKKPLQIMSSFVRTSHDIPELIVKLTGITKEMANSPFSLPIAGAMVELNFLMSEADYVVAHNAKFDKGFILEAAKNSQVKLPGHHWICTMMDVPYPETITSRKLEFLCCQHCFLNPFSHRAIFDVMAMLKLFSMYNFNDIMVLSKSPTLTVQANVSFEHKQKAKEAGFHWNSERRQWLLDVKSVNYHPNNYDFETIIIEENKN
jgi:DNA polymerase-3 subunit epsilon